MMFHVCVIRNINNKIYIGHTDDLEARIKRHDSLLKNKASSYTSKNRCGEWVVAYKEEFETRGEAMAREKQLKSHRGQIIYTEYH